MGKLSPLVLAPVGFRGDVHRRRGFQPRRVRGYAHSPSYAALSYPSKSLKRGGNAAGSRVYGRCRRSKLITLKHAMSQSIFSFRIDDDEAGIHRGRRGVRQGGAELLRGFMGADVKHETDEQEYDTWFCRQVRAGIEDAEAGRVVSADEVEAEFAARREETRRRLDRR